MWEYNGNASPNAMRSPVLSNNGEVVVAHGSFVDVLRQGQLHQRLELDAVAFGSPAIAADGTIYALDGAGRLYAFPYSSYLLSPMLGSLQIGLAQENTDGSPEAINALGQRCRHWHVDLDGAARTSPIVGEHDRRRHRRQGGPRAPGRFQAQAAQRPGQAIIALAADAERNNFVTTTDGYAARINFFLPNCPGGLCVWDHDDTPYARRRCSPMTRSISGAPTAEW